MILVRSRTPTVVPSGATVRKWESPGKVVASKASRSGGGISQSRGTLRLSSNGPA